jgi:hypothetical protein
MRQWYNSFDSDTVQETEMDPYASHIIGQARMKELHEQANRYHQAAQLREEKGRSFRTAAGTWLIRLGQRMAPATRPVELHR